jgi:hypothetical protein
MHPGREHRADKSVPIMLQAEIYGGTMRQCCLVIVVGDV